MRMWIPFKNTDGGRNSDAGRNADAGRNSDAGRSGKKSPGNEDEIAALRRQLQDMQKTIENLDKGT
jgi:hypothetical protein